MSAENINLLPPNEGIKVEKVERRQVQLKETGVNASVRDTAHALTNHYIKMSRPFFPAKQLCQYIDCSNFLQAARWLWFAGFFGFLGVVDIKVFPVLFSIISVVFCLIYCQHEWVNQTSLPVVRKQPVLDGQRHPNQFYEVTVTELKGVALENYQAGIGFIRMTRGKIRFQAFNQTAVETMSRAKCLSRLMLFLFFFMSGYNIYFAFYGKWL